MPSYTQAAVSLILFAGFIVGPLHSQAISQESVKIVRAVQAENSTIDLDGRLDEPLWSDREPDRIVRRLAQRDAVSDADRFALYLDPLHDHRTGVLFEVSAANVRRDAIVSSDTSVEASWDGVWDSAVSVDEVGWSSRCGSP